jgi:hypothetical protein
MKIALIGESGTGKSSLFEILTEEKPYQELPQGGKLATISIPDSRLETLVVKLNPKKYKPVEVSIIDPGVGLRLNSPNIMDAEVLVVIVKKDEEVKTLIEKIFIRDREVVDKKLSNLEGEFKKRHNDEQLEKEFSVFKKAKELLEQKQFLFRQQFSLQEVKFLSGVQPLTLKSIYVVVNQEEKEIADDICSYLDAIGIGYQKFSISLYREIYQLPSSERKIYYQEYNLDENGLQNLLKSIYSSSGYITFYTIVHDEIRAWPLKKGENILTAAGKIHTDMARGFIRAEVVSFDDFCQCEFLLPKAKENGVLRLESKEYVVQEGDIVYIRFKV